MAKRKRPRMAKKEAQKETQITEIPGQVSLERSPFKLKGNIRYLSTDIDSLYKLVLEKKRVRLDAAARSLKVKKEIVEEWGSILEDHHMAVLHYPVAGEASISLPGKSEHKAKHKEAKAEKGKHGHLRPRLTLRRVVIMGEIVALGELLIYIFLVNPNLRNNFLPTLTGTLGNLPGAMSSLMDRLSGNPMGINPLYFVIGIIVVVFWIVIVALRKQKKGNAK
jgi:hypothetical protein